MLPQRGLIWLKQQRSGSGTHWEPINLWVHLDLPSMGSGVLLDILHSLGYLTVLVYALQVSGNDQPSWTITLSLVLILCSIKPAICGHIYCKVRFQKLNKQLILKQIYVGSRVTDAGQP